GRTLGTAIANLCTVVDPEIVVIGGDMSTAGEVLLGPLRDALEQHTLATHVGAPSVVPAEFGGEAELRGALAAALDRARELGALGVAS
ncbi:MAG: transcriptional regulator, partial [Microbacterium sp.]|nr:transcriptional regulator [Microbacterium sp.]